MKSNLKIENKKIRTNVIHNKRERKNAEAIEPAQIKDFFAREASCVGICERANAAWCDIWVFEFVCMHCETMAKGVTETAWRQLSVSLNIRQKGLLEMWTTF